MTPVRLLSPDIIAKIAAGEAIDRPASAVKELLENALDARASRIEIHLQEAGRELIHIKDNGSGISRANLEKLFQRHATSKISTLEHLEKLESLGFRGEALYSIAAISDLVLATSTMTPEGWQMHLHGGIRQNLEPVPLADRGTDIKIRALFFNTPARRKFLKNNAAELHQILNIVLPYTLLYPEKDFVLTHNGRTLLDLKSTLSYTDRMAAALNIPVLELLESSQEFLEDNIRVRMILGTINIQRPRRDLQFIFINNRPVESKNIGFNANAIYKLILPPGVYGAFCLDIHLDPAHVDVNIHPTKREVRVQEEALLIRLLRRMMEYQLMHHGRPKEICANPILFSPEHPQTVYAAAKDYAPNTFISHPLPLAESTLFDLPLDFQLSNPQNTLRALFTQARFIGVFLRKFLLFEAGKSLFIVDQHAAQERILFEKFQYQLTNASIETQPLLTPLVLKLTPQEKIAWEHTQEQLTAAGIETTLFDADTLAIQTQPVLLKNIEIVVRALLADGDIARMDPSILARRACKASIVAGDKLDSSQARHQQEELLQCHDPFTCPHGRPTLISVTEEFLDRQFLRR